MKIKNMILYTWCNVIQCGNTVIFQSISI